MLQLFSLDPPATSTNCPPALLLSAFFVRAGFPSPAQDYLELKIDLNAELIRNVDATFLGRVVGDSMVEEDIEEGDVLIVDKSLSPRPGDIVISSVNGEFTVKRYELRNGCPALIAGNPSFPPIYVGEYDDFVVWGVVTYIIKKQRR